MPSWAYINYKLKTEKAREMQVAKERRAELEARRAKMNKEGEAPSEAAPVAKSVNKLDVSNFPSELDISYYATLGNKTENEYDNGLKSVRYEAGGTVEYDFSDDVLFIDNLYAEIYSDGTVEVEADGEYDSSDMNANSYEQARDIAENLLDNVTAKLIRYRGY